MYEDYFISPLYFIILLQGSYLFEGHNYCKSVMKIFIILTFKKWDLFNGIYLHEFYNEVYPHIYIFF